MFHVRRRPADCQLRRRKKKSGSIRVGGSGGAVGGMPAGVLIETHLDGSPVDNGRSVRIGSEVVEVGSVNGVTLQLYGPSIQPRHCVLATNEGVVTITPLHTDAHTYVNGQRIYHTTILQHGSIVKFDRTSTFRFLDPMQENKLNKQMSQSQNFDSSSMYDRSPTSPIHDNSSGVMSQMYQGSHNKIDMMQTTIDSNMNQSNMGENEFQRAMSPILNNSNMIGSQDNFAMSYGLKNHIESDQISGYSNSNNNNSIKMDSEAMSPHHTSTKSDLVQDNNFVSPYNAPASPNDKEQLELNKMATNQYKDNYETTFDLDGNVETKSICSAKSGGSGHENRMPRGQEAILPAVLEFPEQTQQLFLQNVITRLDVHAPAYKLAPVYTLYLCARYRASTHYRPELTPTERANKLTSLLHHIATLIQATVQEKYLDSTVQAFWMANSSELLHFLKCDRHISAFTIQAQDILSSTVQNAFSNLVGCFHMELSQVLPAFLEEASSENESTNIVISVLNSAMALLRRCRVNAALTIQLFSQLFHYINVWCFNKIVSSPYMICAEWGSLLSSRLAPISIWAERQGLELAADCQFALIHQCAHLLQTPKNTHEDIANLMSVCFKLNSVQLRCLLMGFFEESNGTIKRIPHELIESAVKHAQGVADELHRADGREIVLEESSTLPISLLIPEDGFSADVVRGIPSGLAEFLAPLQRAGLCRLAPQPHSQGHWTVYMTGFNGNNMAVKTAQQPIVEVIQLQKNSNGIGLSIVAAKGAGQSKLGIYIKSVVPGGAAAADQRLQAGDQLLAVDGYSLVGITQERAAEHLVRTGPIVTLHVAKQGAVLHGLATLLRQPSPQTHRGYYSHHYDTGMYRYDLPVLEVDNYSSSSDNSLEVYSPKMKNTNDNKTLDECCRSSSKTDAIFSSAEFEFEQSVDSSCESYDSNCSYSYSVEKGEASCSRQSKKKKKKKQLYQENPIGNNYDDIPYIDDIDNEVIFDNKVGCSENKKLSKSNSTNMNDSVVKLPQGHDRVTTKSSISSRKQSLQLKETEKTEYRNFDYESDDVLSKRVKRDKPFPSKHVDDLNICYGKVKAIAKHFNEINLRYQSSIYKKYFTSSPDVSKNICDPKSFTNLSKSLEDLQERTSKLNEYSTEEKDRIRLQLEDWSKNGTKSTFDIFNTLIPKPKVSIYDTTNDFNRNCNPKVIKNKLSNKIFSNFDKKFGSLEKLTGNPKQKSIDLTSRKTHSASSLNQELKEYTPAIRKSKLILSPKKFPQSYVVKRRSTTTNRSQLNNTSKNVDIVRSCLSLISNNAIDEINNLSESDHSRSFPTLVNSTKSKTRPSKSHCGRIQCCTSNKRNAQISQRRMSERDLPSKVEMEKSSVGGHMSTVKSSKSVPALHEHSKQHEVFNPGYSRASSNNSIPAMVGLKGKNIPAPNTQSDQNSFYQNLSVYRGSGTNDKPANLGNSQSNLTAKPLNTDNQSIQDKYFGNQRPQSAFYGNQAMQNSLNNNLRPAQSTKDLMFNNENSANYPMKGNYPSMPNVNQGYGGQPYNLTSPNQANHGHINRPQNPNLSNQYNNFSPGNQYYAQSQSQLSLQSPMQNMLGNQSNNASNPHINLRGQAKLAEMSEEVTRRQQRGPMNPYDPNIISPLQPKRYPHNIENQNSSNVPMSSNPPMSPIKQQPPVAPKPQNMKRDLSHDMGKDIPEGPPLPPTSTHPLYGQANDDEGGYLASSSDPPAVSFYPTQRQGQNNQSHHPPNPWEREEREKELEARRAAARAWRDQQISSLQSIGEDRRTLQQEQQLRALTLERDFERRAQEAQIDDDDKDVDRTPKGTSSGLLRLASANNNILGNELNLVPVTSNIVSSIQAVSVATSNMNEDQDSLGHHEKISQPPAMPPIQPKSILKSNLRLDNLNSPQSPSKTQKNASFSANLTPQSLKFDNNLKYEPKFEYGNNNNNKFDQGLLSKADAVHFKYGDQSNLSLNKYEQNISSNMNNSSIQSKYDTNMSNMNPDIQSQLSQGMSELYVNSSQNYNRPESSNLGRFESPMYGQDSVAPPPPERGSSFAVMSQQQALRSNLSTSSHAMSYSQNNNNNNNQSAAAIPKDKRVSFHDKDPFLAMSNMNREEEVEHVREDPDRFIMEAENMLQSPSTPTGSNVTHTPGVIGAQEVYRDPRQRRLAEQQKAQQAGNTPIPEKLSFKEKMKMFALESGESNTPKDKVKISRAQRDIDAVH